MKTKDGHFIELMVIKLFRRNYARDLLNEINQILNTLIFVYILILTMISSGVRIGNEEYLK
jgi:hypothetical protein